MTNYINLKFLEKLGYWDIEDGTITFTNLEVKELEDKNNNVPFMGLYTTIEETRYENDSYKVHKDVLLYKFEGNWKPTEQVHMVEIIIDYLNLRFLKLTPKELTVAYLSILKETMNQIK